MKRLPTSQWNCSKVRCKCTWVVALQWFTLTLEWKCLYDWHSTSFVTVPHTYAGVMCGMCGNYNLKLNNEMQMNNGKQVATPEELGQSWRVAEIPGCVHGCKVNNHCPSCDFETNEFCGKIPSTTATPRWIPTASLMTVFTMYALTMATRTHYAVASKCTLQHASRKELWSLHRGPKTSVVSDISYWSYINIIFQSFFPPTFINQAFINSIWLQSSNSLRTVIMRFVPMVALLLVIACLPPTAVRLCVRKDGLVILVSFSVETNVCPSPNVVVFTTIDTTKMEMSSIPMDSARRSAHAMARQVYIGISKACLCIQ